MKKKKALNLVAVGLLIAVGTNVIRGALGDSSDGSSFVEGFLKFVGLIGVAIYVVGLSLFARAKGHTWAWGLTGLACLVGGVSVAFLKDRSTQE